MPRIALTTLGCKVNQFESAAFSSALTEAGCTIVPFAQEADVYIINTCAVTGRAGQQSRQMIRRAAQQNPKAKIVVTGCYAQAEEKTVHELCDPPVVLVGNAQKDKVVQAALQTMTEKKQVDLGDIGTQKTICHLPVRNFSGKTRAFMRIQDGCNNFCSYCIVPYTRGRSRSLPREQVFAQIAVFLAEGYQEIVITGINTGKYGLDLCEGETMSSLLRSLCSLFPSVRFRLSSLEPNEITDGLLDIVLAHPNLMPHFHIPLQSGDDQILARMNRRYTSVFFAKAIEKIQQKLPYAGIGCDVLCGFPGETDVAAARTFAFLKGLPISSLHVFPYSKRPGTPAAQMEGQVSAQEKTRRVNCLRSLDKELRQRFYTSQIGRSFRVLVERRSKEKKYVLQGFTENYIPLQFEGPATVLRSVVSVQLINVEHGYPLGRWVPALEQET